jgi:probable rRNA maturation factor
MPANNGQIEFHYQNQRFTFRNRTRLKNFILSELKKRKQKVEAVNIIFCSDKQLLGINRQYLKHDFYTDIITFPLSNPGEPLIADIYISIDRIKDNTRQFETSFTKELHRVIFHGFLHLLGFGDKSKAEQLVMRDFEARLLSAYFRST